MFLLAEAIDSAYSLSDEYSWWWLWEW